MNSRECKGECRFMESGGMQTLAYYPPIYDKFGRNTNPDMNITYGNVRCMTCNKQWSTTMQNGSTTWTEIKNESNPNETVP